MGLAEGPQHPAPVVRGRAIPTLPGLIVVAVVAGFAGLLAGWELAGGTSGPPPTAGPSASPTPAPIVRPAAVAPSLRSAWSTAGGPGTWLVCRQATRLDCRTLRPVQLAPATAFQASGGLWSRLVPIEMEVGGRFAVVADLSHAVGALVYLAPLTGSWQEAAAVTQGGGIQYVDLGVLPAGRYAVLAESELGPPADGLVEAFGLDVTAP